MDTEFVVKTSKGKIVAIVLLVVSILLIIGGAYYLFFIRITPNKYLNEMSLKTSTYVTEMLDTFSGLKDKDASKNIITSGKFIVNSDDEDLEAFKDLSFNYNTLISPKSNKMNMDIILNDKETELLKESLYLEKNNLYFISNDIYDKPIKLLESNFNFLENQTTYTIDELKDILKNLINYTFQSLEEITMESQNINFQEIKYTYELNKDNLKQVYQKFQELCKKDSNLKNIITFDDLEINENLSPLKIEIITNRFNKEINQITIDEDGTKTEIVKVSKGKYKIDNEDNLLIDSQSLVYEDYENGKKTNSLEINKLKDGINLKVNETDTSFELSIRKIKDNNVRISLKGGDSETYLDFDIDSKIENESTIINLLATIKSSDITFEIKGDLTSKETDEEIDTKDIKDFIELKDLKEEDTEKMLENFVTKIIESQLDSILEDTSL